MGYLHINNLYKDQRILRFRECYALEKIHGTSAHVGATNGKLVVFSGGESHERFSGLFDKDKLLASLLAISEEPIVLFGEAYGGKQQGMSHTYGAELKFIVFDVKIGEAWLNVENAHDVANKVGLEFVSYKRIPTDLAAIDAERDADSEQAVRNGVGVGKIREGIVLRPIDECSDHRGNRIITKHKRDEFKETATPRKVVDPNKLTMERDAERIALEWVTVERMNHVLDKTPCVGIEETGKLIAAMREDVLREAAGEIEVNDKVKAAIAKHTAWLWKKRLQQELHGQEEAQVQA